MKVRTRLSTGRDAGVVGLGALGAKGTESFVELVTGSYDKVLGGTMSASTAQEPAKKVPGVPAPTH